MSAQPAIAPTTAPPQRAPRRGSRHGWSPVVVTGYDVGVSAPGPEDGSEAPGVPHPQAGGPRGPIGPDVSHLAPPTRAAAWRRRAAAAAVPVALALALTGLIGGGTADAELADPVAGTATVAPGETLWDLAAATAPEGTDTRDQLGRIVELNGLDGAQIEPWTVILLPAR